VAGVIDYTRKLSDEIRDLWAELDEQQNRGDTLHERNAELREWLQNQRDDNVVLYGTIGRLEDTIQALLGYTECGCGEDEEGNYGQCVPCQINDEWIYS
jgi:hypothetical protein